VRRGGFILPLLVIIGAQNYRTVPAHVLGSHFNLAPGLTIRLSAVAGGLIVLLITRPGSFSSAGWMMDRAGRTGDRARTKRRRR
jgi:uncharacterized integral membrane protein